MSQEDIKKLLDDGSACFQSGDMDKAISLFEEALKLDPQNANVVLKLAECYAAKGLNSKAAEQYLFIANAYYDSKLNKGAVKFYQKVLEFDSEALDTRVKLVDLYAKEGMQREAKIEFLNIAEAYLKKDDLNKAEEYAKKAIELKSIEAQFVLGMVTFKHELWQEAINAFEYLLKFKPSHLEALSKLGTVYLRIGKFPDATSVFEKILKTKPDDIDALEGLADVYAKRGSMREAVPAYLNIINIFIKQNSPDKAEEIYNKIIKLSPENVDGRTKCANFYETLGKLDSAVTQYLALAGIYVKNKNVDSAKQIYQKILNLDPNCEDAKTKLYALESGGGITQTVSSAKQDVQRTIPKAPVVENTSVVSEVESPKETISSTDDIDFLHFKAEESIKNGFIEKAIELYRTILKKDPKNTDIRQKLHNAYILLAQKEEEIVEKDKGKDTEEVEESNEPTDKKKKRVKISYL
ncbi:MAG: tetratricopeptide repeat protein [Candidatus Firestonebacteria bacterium]